MPVMRGDGKERRRCRRQGGSSLGVRGTDGGQDEWIVTFIAITLTGDPGHQLSRVQIFLKYFWAEKRGLFWGGRPRRDEEAGLQGGAGAVTVRLLRP